jgi:hypothetical protein
MPVPFGLPRPKKLNNAETIDKNRTKANTDLSFYKTVSMGYNTGAVEQVIPEIRAGCRTPHAGCT